MENLFQFFFSESQLWKRFSLFTPKIYSDKLNLEAIFTSPKVVLIFKKYDEMQEANEGV